MAIKIAFTIVKKWRCIHRLHCSWPYHLRDLEQPYILLILVTPIFFSFALISRCFHFLSLLPSTSVYVRVRLKSMFLHPWVICMYVCRLIYTRLLPSSSNSLVHLPSPFPLTLPLPPLPLPSLPFPPHPSHLFSSPCLPSPLLPSPCPALPRTYRHGRLIGVR